MKYLILLILFGCATGVPPKKYNKAQVILLVANWCEPCRHELREFDKLTKNDKISIVAYTETGLFSFHQPTKESADRLKKELGLSIDVLPDEKSWGLFKKYLPAATGKYLPVAVVVWDDAFQVFSPPYVMTDVMAYVRERLR